MTDNDPEMARFKITTQPNFSNNITRIKRLLPLRISIGLFNKIYLNLDMYRIDIMSPVVIFIMIVIA